MIAYATILMLEIVVLYSILVTMLRDFDSLVTEGIQYEHGTLNTEQ